MKDLQKFFDSMPDDSAIEFWDHEKSMGFVIQWSETGRGFGEYTFSVSKKTGKFEIDNEGDSSGSVKRVIDRLVDEKPEEVKKFFHSMVDYGFRQKVNETITLNGEPINKEDY